MQHRVILVTINSMPTIFLIINRKIFFFPLELRIGLCGSNSAYKISRVQILSRLIPCPPYFTKNLIAFPRSFPAAPSQANGPARFHERLSNKRRRSLLNPLPSVKKCLPHFFFLKKMSITHSSL